MFKISYYKQRAREWYIKYTNEIDNYDCGFNLAEYISPDIERYKGKYNYYARKLRALGEPCPLLR